jgi:phage terminase small subunit
VRGGTPSEVSVLKPPLLQETPAKRDSEMVSQHPLLIQGLYVIIFYMDKKKPLTGRQELFCQEYIKDLNSKAAAKRAGYSDKVADAKSYQFLKMDRIRERVAELKQDSMRRLQLDADDILRRLVRIADATEQEGDYNAAIRSLELLGKHKALWTEKTVNETTIMNAFASGNSEEDIQRDVERLKRIATPKLKVVSGDKKK